VTILAAALLGLWFGWTVTFYDWKTRVTYPKQPLGLQLVGGAAELCTLWLAIWVVIS
jgi:hypothetical protein